MPTTPLAPAEKRKIKRAGSRISNVDLLFQALWQSLIENDISSFKEILSTYLDAANKEELVRQAKISRRTLYRMLSPDGNPTLENVAKVLRALAA